jgi:adenylyl-sulfate kinase
MNPEPQGLTVWLTGLSGAGKTTLSAAVHQHFSVRGRRVELLDGDEIREFLSKDLSFSKADRDENIRRIGYVAELLTRHGVITLVSVISPYRAARNAVRARIPAFVEVYVNAPLAVCESRDVKGLYRKARAGVIKCFTGIDDPYEPPLHPEVECRTDLESVAESAAKVIFAIDRRLGGSFH